MTKQRTVGKASTKREKEHADLLEAALARPGVREVMQVYDNWREQDKALDVHRRATKRAEQITTTNSSNV